MSMTDDDKFVVLGPHYKTEFGYDATFEFFRALGWSEDEAKHHATWSPDVTVAVVELLREAARTMEWAEGVEEDSANLKGMQQCREWLRRCEALLDKVKERQG